MILSDLVDSAATRLVCNGQCYMGFMANFVFFVAVEKVEDRLSFDHASAS